MWTCPPCGTTNEAHSIFCAACGAMRYKAPARPSASSEPVTPIPSESSSGSLPLQFNKTASDFALFWIGWTTLGVLCAWFIMQVMSGTIIAYAYRTGSKTGGKLLYIIVTVTFHGWLVGFFQAKSLNRSIEGTRWVAWPWTRLAGVGLSSCIYLLIWDRRRSEGELGTWLGVSAVISLAGGALIGLLQGLLFSRKLGPPGWVVGWTLLTAGAAALGSATGTVLSHSLMWRNGSFTPASGLLSSFLQVMVTGLVASTLTGVPLGRWLRKHPALAATSSSPSP